MRKNHNWTDADLTFLIANYPTQGGHFCAEKLNKNYLNTKGKANSMGLRVFVKKPNTQKLLEDDPISLYWIGFLLADGNFIINREKKSSYLRLRLSVKDMDHVVKFKNFIESDKNIKIEIGGSSNRFCLDSKIANFTFGDKQLIKVCEKFQINNNKTKFPPSLDVFKILTQNQLMCLLIGFIDGDGTIFYKENNPKELPRLRIKNHISWKDFLCFAADTIMNFPDIRKATIRENKQGYIELNIANLGLLQKLKSTAIENKLPIMERKWEIIDLNRRLKLISPSKN